MQLQVAHEHAAIPMTMGIANSARRRILSVPPVLQPLPMYHASAAMHVDGHLPALWTSRCPLPFL
jgi:hypothetical protein